MKEKLKKYWKEILIGILVLFGMSKCTQSCNRQGTVDKLSSQVSSMDSTIKLQEQVINGLVKDTANYINQIRMYKTFDIKRDQADSIAAANLAKQKAQTDALIKKLKK